MLIMYLFMIRIMGGKIDVTSHQGKILFWERANG